MEKKEHPYLENHTERHNYSHSPASSCKLAGKITLGQILLCLILIQSDVNFRFQRHTKGSTLKSAPKFLDKEVTIPLL